MNLDTILNILLVVLTAIMPVLATWLMLWLREKYGAEKMQRVVTELETVDSIAYRAVRLAEDLVKGPGRGRERLAAACAWAEEQLEEKGVQVNEGEIEYFVRAAFNMAKIEIEEARDRIVYPDINAGQ